MTGLVQFVVNLISLFAAGAIFFLSIDRISPDPFFAKIGKIAVGAMLLIALVLTVGGIFGFGGGVTVSPLGVVMFAIAVIVAVCVLYLINLAFDWVSGQAGEPGWAGPVKYVLATIVLVGLLLVAANTLFGYKIGGLDLRPRSDLSDGRKVGLALR